MWNKTYTSSHMSATQWGHHAAEEADAARERIGRRAPPLGWAFRPEEAPSQIEGLAAALHEWATSTWLAFLRTDPTLKRALRPGVDPALAAEWILRIMLSYVSFPGRTGASRQAMRRQLHQLLVPAL